MDILKIYLFTIEYQYCGVILFVMKFDRISESREEDI